jgi:hypothetical protein
MLCFKGKIESEGSYIYKIDEQSNVSEKKKVPQHCHELALL